MLKNIERFLNLSTFMIFHCFAIHALIFDYLKNCIKITYTKEIGYGKLETYMVLRFLCYSISNDYLNFPKEFTIFDFYDASFM